MARTLSLAPALAEGERIHSPYRQVDALVRGLTILRSLNDGLGKTVLRISGETGYNRTTVYRALETMLAEGYVTKSVSSGLYRIASGVHFLSAGFGENANLVAAATPVLAELVKSIEWPTDLLTLQGASMVVLETTSRLSPLCFGASPIGSRWPVLESAAGRAQLAFSQPVQRETMLTDILIDRGISPNAPDLRTMFNRMVEDTRARGYAISIGEVQEKMASLAVPICVDGNAIAALNIVFLRRALRMEAAAAKFLVRMQEAAAAIEVGMRDTS